MASARSDDFKTPEARLSFAYSLFKPRKQDGSDKEKYSCTLIFPKPALTEKVIAYKGRQLSLHDIVGEVILEAWGEKGLEKAKAGLIKSPFLDGAGKEARNKKTGDLHPGMGPDVFFIRTTANVDRQPGVSSSAAAFVPATEKEVYSGCYGYGVVNAFSWTNPQNGDGVSFGVNYFFKRRDGEPLAAGGGGGDPDKWTEAVEDTGPAPAVTQGGAGAGGLFGALS